MFGETLDRTTLTSRIPALKKHHNTLTGFLDPELNLQEFSLKGCFLGFVGRTAQLL